jgi:Flp pilus assembly protein TadG
MEIHQPSRYEEGGIPRKPSLLHRLRETDAGQTLVEFSLILPFMCLLIFALVDFGRGFYTWLLITNAAREGARVAATQVDANTVDARIYNSMCSNYPSDCSLDPAKLHIDKDNVQGSRGEAVVVDLSYEFEFVTPMAGILDLIGGSSLSAPTITAHSSMRLE